MAAATHRPTVVAGAVTGAMTQWRMSAPSIRSFILMRMAPINILGFRVEPIGGVGVGHVKCRGTTKFRVEPISIKVIGL